MDLILVTEMVFHALISSLKFVYSNKLDISLTLDTSHRLIFGLVEVSPPIHAFTAVCNSAFVDGVKTIYNVY